jgi:hypothetical protein
MPSTLPPPSSGITGAGDVKPQYVISQSGHAAHPDDIVQSCRALQSHVAKMQEDAERELKELDERIKARELAEKRKVAPGWLDSEARLLEPKRASGGGNLKRREDEEGVVGQFGQMTIGVPQGVSKMTVDQGAEIDRAFGGME